MPRPLDPNPVEARLVRLSRLYAMASSINEAILRSSEPRELYETACRIAVEGGLLMAWVGFVQGDNVEVVASCGDHGRYVEGMQLSLRESDRGNGPAGRAYRSGVGTVCNDLAADETFAPWRQAALRQGYRSSGAFPLKVQDRTIGLFCVYGDQPGYFEVEEVRLLTALADNLSFFIDAHRQREALRVSEQQVERERARLLEAQSVAKIGSWETELPGPQAFWSPQTHRIFETDPSQFVPTHAAFLERVHPEDRARVSENFEASLLHENPCVMEHRIVVGEGRVKVVEERWRAFFNQAGVAERAVGTCLDITERRQAELESTQAAAALADLVQIQQELTVTQRTVAEVMDFICQRAQALTEADGATVELLEGDYLVYHISSGTARKHTGIRLHRHHSLSGLSVQSSAPLYSSEAETDERVDRAACRLVGVRSMICAPLRVAKQAIGVLKVISRQPHAFKERHLHHMRIMVETLGSIMERQRTAEALRASVEDFRSLAESMPQIVWTTDSNGRCEYLNRLWVDYTGRSLLESLGDGWMSSFHPGDLELSRAAWEGAMRTGCNYSAEFRLRRADGEYRWWLNRAEPLRDSYGEILRWLGTSVDIHDLKVANRALDLVRHCDEALVRAESEPQLLQSICDVAVDLGGYRMAWVAYAQDDPQKSILPQAHAGYEAGYLSEVTISWAEDKPHGQGPGGRVIRSGQLVQIADLARETGFALWLEAARSRGYQSMVNLPLRDEHRTFGYLSLFRPEIARLSADELRLLQELADDLAYGIVALRSRQERQRLQDAVLAIARGVSASVGEDFFVQLAGHLVEAVQADAAFIALCNGSESARTLAAVVHGEVQPNFEYALAGTPCEELLQANTCVYERGVRQRFPADQTLSRLGMEAYVGSAMLNARGQCVGLVAVLFPKPIRQSDFLISTLQIFAARAASEMERKRLEEQFLRAQRLESIGTLAGGIAHDLNNALSPILMSVELLRLQFPDPESRELVDSVAYSAERGAEMVRQLLSFARGVKGERVAVPVASLLKEVAKIANDTFLKTIHVRASSAPDLWPMLGDPTQIQQVLMNLCVNARDAMVGGGKLVLKASNRNLDWGPHLLLEVSDSGVGIAPENLEKIFDPFFTTKDVGQGTGLGLSTSMAIVKSHGGFLQVHSEPGKGSTFEVYLPAQPGEVFCDQDSLEAEMPRGRGELILVVDDEEPVRRITRRSLEYFGYRVLLAADGAEALRLYAAHRREIHLVLTDMMMPNLDGPALIRALLEQDPDLPVIGASGVALPGTQPDLKFLLAKPYKTEILLQALRELLMPLPDAKGLDRK